MTFTETVAAAIADVIEYGYESEERLQYWIDAIKQAALVDLVPEPVLEEQLTKVLQTTFHRMVDQYSVLQRHPGVSKFTLERIRPELRSELDRRIMAAANLIKLNREQAIAKTLQRFQGWATSIPAGGTDVAKKGAVKKDIRKALASLPYEERRVLIDQGHKLSSAISDIVAQDQNAIAAEWRSHWRQQGYDYRQEHKERDRVVYALKDSWAAERGFIRKGEQGWYEDHERPGEFVFCRCYVRWIYNLRDVPKDMLTAKGQAALAEARQKAFG